MLTNNKYYIKYRSFERDFDKDFLIPAYKESILLQRGSGYFSLKSLLLSFEGILDFINHRGEIHLVCNPELSNDDIALIEAGEKLSTAEVYRDILNEIERDAGLSDEEIRQMDVICNMISEEELIIKIAYLPSGIYHEKFGIFTDEIGNKVYFTGSANETVNAKLNNVESFQVSPSWMGFNALVEEEEEYFNKLWNNKLEHFSVIDFSDALKQNLFVKYKRSKSLQDALKNYKHPRPLVEETTIKKLYPYQEQAINEFINKGCVHFYEMATGTGKTFTAIRTIARLREFLDQPLCTIILVPQIDLQIQWKAALEEDGYEKVYLFGGESNNSESSIYNALIESLQGEDVICVAVYDTFFSKAYVQFEDIDNLFIVVDEAHNISKGQFKKLSNNIRYRLGLSATIQRFDEGETKRILEYFTNGECKPFYYGIEEAIERGFLSKYNYFPIFTNLSEDDFSSFQSLTKLIATEMNKSDDDRDDEKLEKYRRDRSLIVKKSPAKIDKLEELIEDGYDFKNSVVYCGMGKNKSDEETTIIDSVTKILDEGNFDVQTFTSNTTNRKDVLNEFESGYYDTLVAIKCFDEGVDVPKLDKIYIMASEGALRQTVQRRGRVLRKCKETGKTIAYIYDMIALPPESAFAFDIGAASLVEAEMRRAKEYNRLALNKDENNIILDKILEKYNITEEDLSNDCE